MTIRDYLKKQILITDGATGTYYSQITGESSDACESANLTRPDVIRRIHEDYIRAGARLIRTNTFSVNSITSNFNREQIRQLVTAAVAIAREAVSSKPIYIAADIGPILDTATVLADNVSRFDEYRFIVDVFLENGITVFNFETFSSLEDLPEITAYIKARQPNAFVITQFTLSADGFTRKGIRLENIITKARQIPSIDAYGFNCGVGPAHLNQILNYFNPGDDLITALPNAGYPEVINERTVYANNPNYFADRMGLLKQRGIRILGGCCGTTPLHIEALIRKLTEKDMSGGRIQTVTIVPPSEETLIKPMDSIWRQHKLIIAAELDPPFDTTVDKVIQGAHAYKSAGVDIVTIADSPMAKARVDSIAIAAKIRREVGIETLPHLCCRDKNLNAIKSGVLAAHIEGIRNILAVTGDPLPGAAKNEIKSVFNFNSIELIRFITQLNAELFASQPVSIGAALNLNVEKPEIELQRMAKKIDQGATFFLTQPIYDDNVIDYLVKIKKNPAVKILAGILPMVNRRNALFLQNELPGMRIPDHLTAHFVDSMDRETAEQTGIELSVETALKMKGFVDGFYLITPFNRTGMIVEILQRLGLGQGDISQGQEKG